MSAAEYAQYNVYEIQYYAQSIGCMFAAVVTVSLLV